MKSLENPSLGKLCVITRTGVFNVYKDLWLSSKQWDKREFTKVKVPGRLCEMKCGEILNYHGLYSAFGVNSDVCYKLRLWKGRKYPSRPVIGVTKII